MRILVVDDKHDERESLADLLRAYQHDVDTAASGREAIEKIERYPDYDLVMIDLVMPDMDGLETLKKLKSLCPGVDVIVITAYATLERAVTAIKEGAYDFLMKPCTNNEIYLSVERVREKRELMEREEEYRESLRKAAEEWEILFENIGDGVFLVDEEFNILRLNRHAGEIMGVSPDKTAGKKCFSLVHGTDSPPPTCPLARAITMVREAENEIYEPYLQKHLRISLTPATSPEGRRYFIHTIRDITGERELEEALRNTKGQILDIFDHSPFPIVVLEVDYRIRFANKKGAELIGRPLKEIVGRHCYEVAHGRDTICDECLVEEVKKKGKPLYDERHIVKEDGREVWFDRVFYPLYDGKGNLECVVEVIRDVTEQRISERKLRESQEFLTSVLEGIGEAVVVIDRDMRIVTANTGYIRQAKRDRDEVIGRHCYEISHGLDMPCDEAGEDCAVRKTFHDGKHHSALHVHTGGDGSKIYVETNAYPLRDGEGNVNMFVETVADVTERVKLERKVKESERRYRDLYNNAPDLMHSLDEEGRIIECNDTECRVLGYSREELIGKHLKELLPEEYHSLFDLKFRELMERGSAEVEWELKRKDGTRIRVLVRAATIRDEDGRFIKTSTVMHDVTTLRRLERERESLTAQLLQAQKMEALGTLSAGIAHDFNNMLTGITGFAEMLMMKAGDEDMKRTARRIMEIAERAADLTSQILIIGRKAPVKMEEVDLNGFIADSLNSLRRMIEETVEMEWIPGKSIPPVMADKGQLYQVLLNLVVNARDALSGKGRIEIRTGRSETCCRDTSNGRTACAFSLINDEKKETRADGYVYISVKDNGPGIPDDVRQKIFDPFFTTKEVGKGTGLGLSVVYSIVEAHGGCIDLVSSKGGGTEFIIYLPLQTQGASGAGEDADAPAPGGRMTDFQGKTALVADDEEIVREIFSDFLSSMGFEVVSLPNGKTALERYIKDPHGYDLVILDRVMPGMTGTEVFQKIREINPSQKVIISTGYTMPEELKKIEDMGVTGVLSKPFSFKDIVNLLTRVFQ